MPVINVNTKQNNQVIISRDMLTQCIEMLSLDRSDQCLIYLLVLQYMLLVCYAVGPDDMYNNLDGCQSYMSLKQKLFSMSKESE